MQLTLDRDVLARLANQAGRALLSARMANINLSHLLFEMSADGWLTVTGTNLEMVIRVRAGMQTLTPETGAFTLPARLLSQVLGSFPDGPVTITVDGSFRADVRSGRTHTQMAGFDPADWPSIPVVQGGPALRVPGQALSQAIGRVALAAAKEDSRPILTGVLLDGDGDRLTLAAADGFRLAVQRLTLPEPLPAPLRAVIPADTVREVERLAAGEMVEIAVNEARNHVRFSGDGWEVTGVALAGEFPNFDQLIPEHQTAVAVLPVAGALREVGLARTVNAGAKAQDTVRLYLGTDGVWLGYPQNADADARGESFLACAREGEPGMTALSGGYLQDALKAVGGDVARLGIAGPSLPVVLRPDGDDSYIHVIMPLFIDWTAQPDPRTAQTAAGVA